MTAPGAPRKKPMLLAIQLIALLLVAFGIAVSPTLFSSAPAYNRPWGQVLLTTAVIALILFGLGRLAPALNKGLTVLLVIGALIVPAIVIGLVAVTRGEQLSARWEVHSALRKAMKPERLEDLAAYLEQPAGPQNGLAPTPEDMEGLRQYVATLPVDALKQHRVAQRLLKGLEIRPSDSRSSQLPDESLEVLCRLFVDLQQRLGLALEELPLDSRQRARFASRVAAVGLVGWRGELTAEHPAYTRLSPFFYKETFLEQFPQPLASGERVYSTTLGSLPLYLLLKNRDLVQPEPGTPPVEDPYDFAASHRKDVRELLDAMKSRGVDFTEEELRDPDLQTFLASLRAP